MKSPRRIVIYTEEVYRKMVNRAFSRFPNETGGFLISSGLDNDQEVFCILDLYHDDKTTKENTGSWSFTEASILGAHRRAARKNMMMVGMYHSHPWKIIPTGIACQSHRDVEVQDRQNFRLSLIVGITHGKFTTSVWRAGFAAPYHQLIYPIDSEDAVRLDQYYKTKKEDPFWSQSFGLGTTEEKLGIA